jgi:hypothetical protein
MAGTKTGRDPPVRRLALLLVCLLAAVGCGSGGSTTTATTTTGPKPTTTTAPSAVVDIQPLSGPIGTVFQLHAMGFQAGEMVTFQITFPDSKNFKGPAHKAAADGTVATTFQITAGNPTGSYQVIATGDKGTQGSGEFQVTTGTAVASTAATLHSTTTVPGRLTTTTKSP